MNWPNILPELQHLIVISTRTIREAEKQILACESCSLATAELPFDWILDEITGSDSTITEYVMENPAVCPGCGRNVFEKTLVEPA